jgi:cell division protein FtsB
VFGSVGNEDKPVGEQVQNGVVFRHRQSGRRYLVTTLPGKELSIDELREDVETYKTAWASKIAGVEMVFEKKEEAESYYVQFSEIDLRPSIIARRYSELKAMLTLAESVDAVLPSIDTGTLKALLEAGKDVEEIARLQQKYARIKKDVANVKREIGRLASIAENMGLILCTKKRDIKSPDGEKTIRTLEEGMIYSPYQHKITWTTTHTRQQLQWAFFFYYHKSVTVTRQHFEIITDYKVVDTSVDLLMRWRVEHMEKNPQDEVIVLQQAGKRFVAADGSPLRAIMVRCDLDESFRRHCVVLLPVFEGSLTGEHILAKYHVFKHPLPGITPAIMPRLTLEESLSYRTVWDGMVLGELANTINLAPGEQRTIHVSKAYKREATVSRTAVSVFDVNRAESSDLATEMERIARQERERSANLQTETSASGGAFGVTASASVKAGVTTSAKEFGQSMARVAKNAAASVTQQNREEVTTSSTVQTTVETTEETTAEIRNINEGRTLNLMFYRLYNRYKGGLYMEGLQFNLIPSVETIAGSGVFEAETYSAAELDKVLDKLQQNPLMLDLDPEAELRLRETVLIELFSLITKEYGDQEEEADKLLLGAEAGQKMPLRPAVQPKLSVNVLPIKGLDATVALSTVFGSAEHRPKRSVEESKKNVKDIQEKLDTVLRTSVAALKTKQQIEPVNLMVGSGGLYLDASVGALPSTEPYSEEMRKREIRMRDAEIFAMRSKVPPSGPGKLESAHLGSQHIYRTWRLATASRRRSKG